MRGLRAMRFVSNEEIKIRELGPESHIPPPTPMLHDWRRNGEWERSNVQVARPPVSTPHSHAVPGIPYQELQYHGTVNEEMVD
jgi:hypothetical protein